MRKPDEIRRLVAAQLDQPLDSLPDALPIREAVVDSFALVELVIRLQEETGLQINGDDMRRVESVGDLISVFVDDQHSCRDSAGT
ncbi:MAG: acyl carrier protein [Gammaproteobacteria bacterium]|nr:MAG: acyl carrier protein [Gammaproteobacteria bacterium]